MAGVAATTLVGAVGAFVAHGGLDTPTAAAATPTEQAFANMPALHPFDVEAVRADLAAAEAAMHVVQVATDPAMARLERLSR
jgi:hypothetical protein